MKTFQSALVAFAVSTAVSASPLGKRQATDSIVPSGSILPSGPGSLSIVPSLVSSASGVLSGPPVPVVPSATSASSAPSASSSSAAFGFSCPSPYLLTYVQKEATLNVPFSSAGPMVANFTNATYLGEVSSTGNGTSIGDTRTLLIPGANTTVVETLTNYTVNATSGGIIEMYTSPGGVDLGSFILGNYSAEFQAYPNDTLPTETTLKYFVNFCASEQSAGLAGLTAYADAVFANITSLLTGASASSSASMMAPASSSMAASATSMMSMASASGSMTPSAVFSSASAAATGALMINTPPALVQCEPIQIVYSGGSAPYFLSVLPGGQTGATPIEQFPQQSSAGGYTWTVNVAAGTSVTLAIRDGAGDVNYSSQITVQSSADSSCLSS